MARIIDKDTRLIDIDFGGLDITVNRTAGDDNPSSSTVAGNGQSQLLNAIGGSNAGVGSFIQYDRLDLSHMVMNNEVMLPVEVSVQRTSPVPLGFSNNGNNFDQIEEYVYVFSRPLNNHNLGPASAFMTNVNQMEDLRDMGLDGSEGAGDLSGVAGWPTQAQCIYAEKRMYSYSSQIMATIGNGELTDPNQGRVDPTPVVPIVYNSLAGMPVLDSVTNWGSMSAITGPNLHVYRIVLNRTQTLPNLGEITNLALTGQSQCRWPPVSVRFLCKDPDYSEGEYLTRLANAMNNTAEDGPTA